MGLSVTPFLKDALMDLYFRETCDQEGWAYVSPKDISFKEKNTLAFSKGPRRIIQVKVHGQFVPEIREAAAVFDYLACKVGQKEHGATAVIVASPLALCWVKTRNGKNFTDGQLDQMARIKLPLAVFRVRDVLAPPAKIETKWETKSGKEWLDEIDDKREEAESDDDYL
ncbi:hypothetical protein [Nitrososphaera viennensis]|uniref:Uncharacterized protein n=2 Tax=Nitrososphaera viennensis TaxID=1034015 RepID=A0A060HTZ4_9ARCH|nr:hypothetical protein [Nitrososphaera viennensis]AIC16572.1 hypothetical protein NVIE_023130 [Nitrososphaera viennensis EN76]UVS68505.1 hypothetical protein NWT39_11405 [Nitrososphaera viennensis]